MFKLLAALTLFGGAVYGQNVGQVAKGSGAPSSASCSTAVNVGSVYMRTDANATNSSFYVCSNTAASTYAWELVQGSGGGGSGSVTSVGLSMPSSFCGVTNSPVTSTGTLTCSYATSQTANLIFGTNGSGNVGLMNLTAAQLPVTVLQTNFANIITTAGASSTPALLFNGNIYTSGTASSNWPLLLLQPSGTTSSAWNTGGTYFGINASTGFGGNLFDLQVAGNSKASINATGTIAATTLIAGGGLPGSYSLVSGSGNIASLVLNSAGFIAPVSGGTSYLLKMPATITAGILAVAAPSTGDGVNESLMSSMAVQGNGTKVQLSTGTTTANDCVKFDSNGNAVDAGSACNSGAGSGSSVSATFSTAATSGTLTHSFGSTSHIDQCVNGSNELVLPTTLTIGSSSDTFTFSGGLSASTVCTATTGGGNASALTPPSSGTNVLLYGSSGSTNTLPVTIGSNLTFSSGTLSASSTAATAFSALTGSTNTSAAMIVGTGASLATSGTGTIAATSATSATVLSSVSGIDPTGVSDSGAAIRAALAASSTANLALPCGTFKSTSRITLTRSQTLYGTGNCTILSFATLSASAGPAIVIADSTNANLYQITTLRNLTIQGPGYSVTGVSGIALGGDPAGSYSSSSAYGDGVNLNNLRITGFYTGIQFGNNAYVNTFDQVFIFANTTGIIFPSGLTNSGEREVVINSSIFNNAADGIYIPGSGEFMISKTSLDYNRNAIEWAGGAMFISQCHFEEQDAPILIFDSGYGNVVIRDSDFLVQNTSGSATHIFDFYPQGMTLTINGIDVFSNYTIPNFLRIQGTMIGSVSDVASGQNITNFTDNTGYSATNWNQSNTPWQTGQTLNGVALPASAQLLATNSSKQITPITLGTNLSITSGVLNASGSGSSAFSSLTSGTNTSAAMTVGSGASIAPTGSGTVTANAYSGQLPVANGGSGTSSPTLVAGTNVTITGSWPNQTITASSTGSTAFSALTGSTNTSAAMVIGTGASLATTGSGSIAATTASALASTPTTCSTGYAPTGILANGNATGCASIGSGGSGLQPPSSGTNVLITASNGSTATSPVTIGTGLSLASGTLSATGTTTSSALVTVSNAHTAFGDSITAGTGASITNTDYVNDLTRIENSVPSNFGVAGNISCDQSGTMVNTSPTYANNPIMTEMIGTNDANNGVSQTLIFEPCWLGGVTWVTIANSQKIFSATQTGSWSNFGSGYYSTTNGSTLTYSITTTGGPIYLWDHIDSTWGSGAFSLTIDGTSEGSFSSYPAAFTGSGNNNGLAGYRFPVSSGTHTVVATVTSSTSSSNIVGIYGVGTAPPSSQIKYLMPPRIFVGGVPRQQGDANSSTTAAYNSDVVTMASELAGDGLNVVFVNIRATLCSQLISGNCAGPSGAYDMANSLHPNDQGHLELAQAFSAAEQVVPSSGPLVYTVGTLPTCSSSAGQYAYLTGYTVSDAQNITYLGALTGGSNKRVPVFCDPGNNQWVSY